MKLLLDCIAGLGLNQRKKERGVGVPAPINFDIKPIGSCRYLQLFIKPWGLPQKAQPSGC